MPKEEWMIVLDATESSCKSEVEVWRGQLRMESERLLVILLEYFRCWNILGAEEIWESGNSSQEIRLPVAGEPQDGDWVKREVCLNVFDVVS